MISEAKIFRLAALFCCGVFGVAALQPAVQADAGEAATPSATVVAGPLRAADPAEAEGIIFERQQIMLQLEKDAEQLGLIVAGLAPREKLAETARAVANGAKDADISFQAPVEGGRSKPEVWLNNADYRQQMQIFVTKSDTMAKMAEAGNFNGVLEILNDAMPCKACHDIYRAPKKKPV